MECCVGRGEYDNEERGVLFGELLVVFKIKTFFFSLRTTGCEHQYEFYVALAIGYFYVCV